MAGRSQKDSHQVVDFPRVREIVLVVCNGKWYRKRGQLDSVQSHRVQDHTLITITRPATSDQSYDQAAGIR